MAAGLFDAGLVIKTTVDILADITAQQRSLIADDLDEGAEEILGQLNGVVAAKIREVWELAAAVHASFDPRSAFGQSLIARCAFTGTTPRAATLGSVTLSLTLAAHTTVADESPERTTFRPFSEQVPEIAKLATFDAFTYELAAGEVIATAGTPVFLVKLRESWAAALPATSE
jgi:hypothetical protein